MAQWRRWARVLLMCGAFVVLYFVVPLTRPLPQPDYVVKAALALLVFALLAFLVVRQLKLQVVDGEDRSLDGLVVVVVAVVLVFALTFYLLEDRNPGQVPGLETRVDALYFAMTTLLTVGFGDIHAQGQVARVLVIVQLVFNGVFLAAAANVASARVRTVVEARAQARAARGQAPRAP